MSLNEESQQLVNRLIDELRVAIPQTYETLCEEFPDLCGFAIGTTSIVEFVVPIFQTRSELPNDDTEANNEQRFWPPEWEVMNQGERNDSFGEHVDNAATNLNAHCAATNYEFGGDIADAYLNSLLALLVDLESAGKLGEKNDERYLTIWLAGDDEEWIFKSSEQLNSSALHQRVLQMYG